MSDSRAVRVGEEIQREIARMLSTGRLKDDRIGFVTITGVRVNSDLRQAKVYFVVHGAEDEQRQTAEALQEHAGRLRSHIGKVMRIRRAPELTFTPDASIDEGMKIERLLQEVREKEGW